MNVERSTVGTKKSRQPKRQKWLNLVQSRQSLTTVRLYTCSWQLMINDSKPASDQCPTYNQMTFHKFI